MSASLVIRAPVWERIVQTIDIDEQNGQFAEQKFCYVAEQYTLRYEFLQQILLLRGRDKYRALTIA